GRKASRRRRELAREPDRGWIEVGGRSIPLSARCRSGRRVTVGVSGSDMIQLRRADPVALIVRDEHVPVRTEETDAVGRAQSAGNGFRGGAVGRDPDQPACERDIPAGALAAEGEEVAAVVGNGRSEGERVVIAGEAPVVVEALEAV